MTIQIDRSKLRLLIGACCDIAREASEIQRRASYLSETVSSILDEAQKLEESELKEAQRASST